MDDQDQERHFIGDLLADLASEMQENNDVFRDNDEMSGVNYGGVQNHTCLPKTNVANAPNPIGPLPAQASGFWPEPPPPYSPPNRWYPGQPTPVFDPSVPPPPVFPAAPPPPASMSDFEKAAYMRNLSGGTSNLSQSSIAGNSMFAPGFYSPFSSQQQNITAFATPQTQTGLRHSIGEYELVGAPANTHKQVQHQQSDPRFGTFSSGVAVASSDGASMIPSYQQQQHMFMTHPSSGLFGSSTLVAPRKPTATIPPTPSAGNPVIVAAPQSRNNASPPTTVPLPKTGVSYSAAASNKTSKNETRAQRSNSAKPLNAMNKMSSMWTAVSTNDEGEWTLSEKESINVKLHNGTGDSSKDQTTRSSTDDSSPTSQHPQNTTGHATTTRNEFQQISRKGKKGAKANKERKTNAERDAANDSATSRFQLLAESTTIGQAPLTTPLSSDATGETSPLPSEDSSFSALLLGKSRTGSTSSSNAPNAATGVTNRSRTGSSRPNAASGNPRGATYGKRAKRANAPESLVWAWTTFFALTAWSYISLVLCWLRDLLVDVFTSLAEIAWHGARHISSRTCVQMERVYHGLCDRMYSFSLSVRHPRSWLEKFSFDWRFWRRFTSSTSTEMESWGLDETIELPTTGEEAMRRLLLCRARSHQLDAYSILGLRADCTDDEIKRYYKRQAVLVHPDKNNAHGADEAFKILAAAFEMIGEPKKRQQYDLANIHRTKQMKEFEELVRQLRAKMDEAASMMHCDCGATHRRYDTKRDPTLCRFCRRCNEMHPARDNDIWAESRWLGFLWYYYACIGGVVYDITEWAGCPTNLLKHMKANSHTVQYRLMSQRQQQQQSSPTEAELDAWLSRVSGLATAKSDAFGGHSVSHGSTTAHGGTTRRGDCGSGSATTTASYQPPERGSARKAGRRRKAK